MLDRPESLCRIREVKFFQEMTYYPGIHTQEAAVRIRSLTKWALLCALLVCAMSNNPSQTLGALFLYTPANVIHVDLTNIEGVPAHCIYPISSDLLPPSAQTAANVALWFSNLAFKSSPAVECYHPAGCNQANNISALYVITFISRNTFSETVENHFSLSV